VTATPEPQPEGAYGEQYEDLVPEDATVDQYDPARFSLITGLVHNIDRSPLPGVTITVHSHAEYGSVTTDDQGRFSIPVEGGGTLTVVYEKQGLIPAQRKVYVPWNDNAIAEIVVMITEDPVGTTLTFDGNADTVVTHKSEDVIDDAGTRAVTMVFSGDNKAYLVDEQGNDVQELTTITTRATEYQTPQAMPARLPLNSAFTYCAELSVDGAQRVRFEKPVTTFIDNFLGFPVGSIVPVGYYDRGSGYPQRTVWLLNFWTPMPMVRWMRWMPMGMAHPMIWMQTVLWAVKLGGLATTSATLPEPPSGGLSLHPLGLQLALRPARRCDCLKCRRNICC
jgi:hypothetical protein